jgi:cytochrome b involved in lipid metabolism
MKEGEQLSLQYLIVDKQPENKLKTNQLPVVVLVSPTGAKITLKINERSKFYEPFGKTNYLYLARYSSTAITGTYSVEITSKAKAAITIAVGDKEVSGEVVRGPASSAAPKPSALPTPSTTSSELTLNKVRENNTASSCWSIINGNVYNLTNWIGSHPGGRSAITSLCGVDGTAAFNAQHRGEPRPESRLASYLLGKLSS